jgi:hypothetical protein
MVPAGRQARQVAWLTFPIPDGKGRSPSKQVNEPTAALSRWLTLHGDLTSFLFRSASAMTALMTRSAQPIRLAAPYDASRR